MKTTVITLADMLPLLDQIDIVAAMEHGFVQYSNGNSVVPPVGELLFDKPKGDAHIKYGYIKQDDFYCIKIASGFYDNAQLGINSSQGLMLLFSQQTGVPVAVLLDEGFLTDIRTAAAGALAAKYFAPNTVRAIGILGSGIQAREQLKMLKQQTPCRRVILWSRNSDNSAKFANELADEFDVEVAASASEMAQQCNLIVCTTPAEAPLLMASDIQPGTHITAVGSDTEHKQELHADILAKADKVIADSLPQSQSRGEIYQATKAGAINSADVIELGTALQNRELQRNDDEQITVVDLTGVAVQDIMIATAVYQNYQQVQGK
ncbi:MAG: ornithine cyclodeaminase [Gammaproteobacteria bacterium]|jgi:ornithine cyclodeaminase